MFRFGLISRISTIVIVALMATWLGVIAISFRSYDLVDEYTRPGPGQIAALVELLERASKEDRPLILNTVKSAGLNARIESRMFAPPNSSAAFPNKIEQIYLPALGERPFAITPVTTESAMGYLRWFSWTTRRGLEFQIPLNTSETLVVDTRRQLFVTWLGLPIGLGAGMFGTLAAIAALITMYWQMRPLVRLVHAVDQIDPTGPPIALGQIHTGAAEIRSLVAAFDRLQTRLTQVLRGRVAMLGGISHDVRTSATRLRLRLDNMNESAERDKAISDIADMIRLLDDALLASRFVSGELTEELLEFGELVHTEIEDQQATGAKATLQMSAKVADLTVLGDRLALRRIVSNLVENALKYGHRAHVSVEQTSATTISLIIDDEGEGIRAEMRDLLFEPFFRIESSRSRHTGGAGLGLAVVRNLVEAHRGTIAISDAPTGGARFTINLPVFVAETTF